MGAPTLKLHAPLSFRDLLRRREEEGGRGASKILRPRPGLLGRNQRIIFCSYLTLIKLKLSPIALKRIEMDELTNRSRTYAEAVVTMVWLVLIAGVTGLNVPNLMLILGGSTIITGVCPLLACCIVNNPRAFTGAMSVFSAAILFSLACWIASFTVWFYCLLVVATASLWITGFRIISHRREKSQYGYPTRTREFHTVLDGSHEFLCCMTGIHFLWLESLALEGMVSKSNGIKKDLSKAMGNINILCCATGLFTILIEMTPPITSSKLGDIIGPLFWVDTIMIISIGTVLVVAMWKSLGLLLLFFGTLAVIALLAVVSALVLLVSCLVEAAGRQDKDPPKLAPLGLIKLMVSGFLTVSVRVNLTDRPITKWFLVFAAAAIISGLTWRLLTQAQVTEMLEEREMSEVTETIPNQEPLTQGEEREMLEVTETIPSQELLTQDEEREMTESREIIPTQGQDQVWEKLENNKSTSVSQARKDTYAKTACLCAHLFVAIATVLLVIEIYNVKYPAIAAAPAPAPAPACT